MQKESEISERNSGGGNNDDCKKGNKRKRQGESTASKPRVVSRVREPVSDQTISGSGHVT